jgi:hypothetical protein
MKQHDIEEFEFSQAYLFFWDKVRQHPEARCVVKEQLLEMWRCILLFLLLSDREVQLFPYEHGESCASRGSCGWEIGFILAACRCKVCRAV